MAYSVAQRTREVGVRMALGAQPGCVIRLVLGQSLALTVLGIAVGLGASLMVTRYLQTLLFGLTPLDPITFLAVTVLFSAVAALAAFVPARRAMRVDPLVALRAERTTTAFFGEHIVCLARVAGEFLEPQRTRRLLFHVGYQLCGLGAHCGSYSAPSTALSKL